jgi:hypothetical protein
MSRLRARSAAAAVGAGVVVAREGLTVYDDREYSRWEDDGGAPERPLPIWVALKDAAAEVAHGVMAAAKMVGDFAAHVLDDDSPAKPDDKPKE